MADEPIKIKFDARKPDGTVTKLELEPGDVLSAAIALIGVGQAVEVRKDGVPRYRIIVHELPQPKNGERGAKPVCS